MRARAAKQLTWSEVDAEPPHIDTTERGLRQAIATLESVASRATGARFAERAAALERLELDVLARLEHVTEQRADLHALRLKAASLQGRLEAANERVVRRLRDRIAAGRYSADGLKRALARHAGPPQQQGYDALDLIVAGLMDAGSEPQERVVLEPDMVAYQPTPARVILSLLERTKLGPSDVLYDLGSGLGWVVTLAALLSGARAKGVELEPAYCEYAAYCARRLNARGVEWIQADARTARLTDGTVFYLYTPFRGALLQSVLERLRSEARQRRILVCTYGPCTTVVSKLDWLKLRDSALDEREVAVFASL
jgi:SAM-dependent methyltransferase